MHGVSVRVQLPRQYWYRTSWMQQRRQQTRFRLGLVEQLAASKQLRMQTLFFLDELASTGHSTRVGRLRHCSCGSLQRFVVCFSVLFCPIHTRSVPGIRRACGQRSERWRSCGGVLRRQHAQPASTFNNALTALLPVMRQGFLALVHDLPSSMEQTDFLCTSEYNAWSWTVAARSSSRENRTTQRLQGASCASTAR